MSNISITASSRLVDLEAILEGRYFTTAYGFRCLRVAHAPQPVRGLYLPFDGSWTVCVDQSEKKDYLAQPIDRVELEFERLEEISPDRLPPGALFISATGSHIAVRNWSHPEQRMLVDLDTGLVRHVNITDPSGQYTIDWTLKAWRGDLMVVSEGASASL